MFSSVTWGGGTTQPCTGHHKKKRTVFKEKKMYTKKRKYSSEDGVNSRLLFVGGQGVQELAKLDDVFIITGCGIFDLSLTPLFFSLYNSVSHTLSVALSTCLTAISYQCIFVIPNRTLPKE